MGYFQDTQVDEYKLAIIQRKRYDEDPMCPHCEMNVRPEDERVLRFVDTDKLTGTVQVCAECHEPILVLDEPKMEQADTYFIHVKLK